MKKHFKILCVMALAGVTAGCVAPQASNQYYCSQQMQAADVKYGTISSVRAVELRAAKGDTDLFAGAALGGIAGALVGDQFGKGSGNAIMTGAGAIAGAAVGSSALKSANRKMGQEWVVDLDNGRTISVIQNDASLAPGMRVSVTQSGSETRLAPSNR